MEPVSAASLESSRRNRAFCFGETPCPGGCRYCFAHWYQCPSGAADAISECTSDAVVYPVCDGELRTQPEAWFSRLSERLLPLRDKVVISLSTKLGLDDRARAYVRELLRLGFNVKVSVSFTTKYRLDELEPSTLSYQDRLTALADFAQASLPTSVVMKPLLPFIDLNEYCEIVDDTIALTKLYMIGDLYVNENDAFYRDYIQNRYPTVPKRVGWLPDQPVWLTVADERRKSALSDYITAKGGACFSDDRSLVNRLFQR